MKFNILLVGDYSREDFLYVAKALHNHYNIFFLEFLNKTEARSAAYKKLGKEIFWKDYKDAKDLIRKVQPEKVVFYFIESLNHVALNVTCKHLGVRTYHIEHGIRNYDYQKKNRKIVVKTRKQAWSSFFTKLSTGISRLKNRQFFLNTVKCLPETEATFLKEYFKVRISNPIFETFEKVNNKLRVADCYISFSPKIFEFHQVSDHLPSDYPVFFIGCPSFDHLAELGHISQQGNNILFIDQSFEKQQLFGWNEESKSKFLDELLIFATKHNKKIWIKKHPYSSEVVFAKYKNNEAIDIMSDEKRFKTAICDSTMIIGFFSTLLMPLMAMDHTVCFSLEMHPSPAKEGLSTFLVNTGAIKRIDSWEELATALENIDMVYNEQKKRKQQFIDDWLYKFDGKSTERLRTILLKDEAA